jgi:hypothetical protein
MQKRRRFKQSQSLKDRLSLFAEDARKAADELPPGPAKDDMLRKARQADTATSRRMGQFGRLAAAQMMHEGASVGGLFHSSCRGDRSARAKLTTMPPSPL